MPKKQKKFVYDSHGKKVAILLSVSKFDNLLDRLEDIDDIKLAEKYDKKKPTKWYTLEEVMAEINKKP